MKQCPNCGAVLAEEPAGAPALLLPVDRGLISWFFLTIVTLGIYPVVAMSNISAEVNLVATRRDRLHTSNGVLAFLLAPLTLGIYPIVWWHKISGRIGRELQARGVDYPFGAASFWLWAVLGNLLCGLGPLIFIHKFASAMNRLNAHYNAYGAFVSDAAVAVPVPVIPVSPASAPVGFVAAPAPLSPVAPADPANAPIVPVSVAGSDRVSCMAAILLTFGFVHIFVIRLSWVGYWRYHLSLCIDPSVFFVLQIVFLVGAFMLSSSRFVRSKAPGCLWILFGVGLFILMLYPFAARSLGLPHSWWWYDGFERLGNTVLAIGVFATGILLLARRRTGAMACLLIAAAGVLVPFLRTAFGFVRALLADYQDYHFTTPDSLLWVVLMMSDILIVIGLVVLALAVRKNAHGTSYPATAVPIPIHVASVSDPVPLTPSPVGFAEAPAPILPAPSTDLAVASSTVVGSGPVPRMAAILLLVGAVHSFILKLWIVVEFGIDLSSCIDQGVLFVLQIVLLVGAFMLSSFRFARSKAPGCLWILFGVGLFILMLYPFAANYLGLPHSWWWYDGFEWLGNIVLAIGVFATGILLLARRRTGVMACLLIAAAGVLVPFLRGAFWIFARGLLDPRYLHPSALRWVRFNMSSILMVAGLVVLALAVRKAVLPGRDEAARP